MLQCDVPRNGSLECLKGEKNRGRCIVAFPRVGSSTVFFYRMYFTPAFTNPGNSVGRVGIYKPLCQKSVSLWHIISWCLKGLIGLGTPLRLMGRAGCHLLIISCLFVFCGFCFIVVVFNLL